MMTTQQWVDAILRLIGYLISWPMVTLLIATALRRRIIFTLTALSERARRASLGPVTVEFDEIAVEALQDTARQAAQDFGSNPAQLADFLGEQISKMGEQAPARDEKSFSGSRILWVDDNIQHNLFEMKYVQRLGVVVETATTTEAALRALETGRFDLVISDMHRVENGVEEPQAGLNLLRQIRPRQRVPLIIYTSNASLLRKNADISEYGAIVTDTASDLFTEVKRAIRHRDSEGGIRRFIPGQRRTPGTMPS
jgi:CheY-like chemotaxis protein